MKKKISFLTIISSIFGVAAISGLFSLSILDNNKSQEASAVDLVIGSQSLSLSLEYTGNHVNPANSQRVNTSHGDTSIFLNATAYLIKTTYSDTNSYRISIDFDYMSLHNSYLSTTFYLQSGSIASPSRAFRLDSTSMSSEILDYYLNIDVISLQNYGSSYDEKAGAAHVDFSLYDSNDNLITFLDDVFFVLKSEYQLPDNQQFIDEMEFNDHTSMASAFPSFELFALHFNDLEGDYTAGFGDGYSSGYAEGYNAGNSAGYYQGYGQGYDSALENQQSLLDSAYASGYSVGYNAGVSSDSTANTIFNGILTVGMLPINFFLSIFNFEILGINLSGFIRAIFTVMLTIIVVKFVLGNTSGGGD